METGVSFILAAMLAAPFLLLLFAVGCSSKLVAYRDIHVDTSTDQMDVGGVDPNVIQMPSPRGLARQCTQGAYGVWSHSYPSTLHDLDLDTSNVSDEEVYAPVAGIARVHTESATENFGYHVNIDLGDGTYVVLAHLKEIFVEDGEPVAVGEMIGYEGCTGACTGDHIHIGLHRGDAGQMAQFGASIPASYFAGDDTAAGEAEDILGDDFVCGRVSLGDPVNGHFYRSALPVPVSHPDGTLVKTPDDPKVYRLDDRAIRWITNEEVFASYGYDFRDVVLISDEERNAYGVGADLDEFGLVDAVEDEQGQLWLVVAPRERADRYRIAVRETAWMAVLASWGLDYSEDNPVPVVSADHAYLHDWPIAAGNAKFRDGSLVKEVSTSTVYVISDAIALPIKNETAYELAGFQERNVLTVADGQVEEVEGDTGDCATGVHCLDEAAITLGQ